MASVSSSSQVCYISNLSMPSSHESSLSWNIPAISIINLHVYQAVDGQLCVPKDRTIKASELVLMGLQRMYAYKPDLKAFPSKTCVNFLTNQNRQTTYYKLRDDITHDLNEMKYVHLIYHSGITQIERDVFGPKFKIVSKIVQLADQLLVSLLKQEEREITYSEFSNITEELTSYASVTNTTHVDWRVKKDHIIDRFGFLSYSLIFFRDNLFPKEEYESRITAVAVKANLPKHIVDIIIKYEFSKMINPKIHIHSSPSNSDSRCCILL